MKSKYCSKLSPNDVLRMRKMAEKGLAIQDIARQFKCRPNAVYHRVYDVIPPRIFTDVEIKKSLRMSKLTIAKVRKIRELSVKKGVDAVSLAKKYNVSPTTILGIVNGKTFRWIEGETRKGYIKPIEYKATIISDKKRGTKKGTRKTLKNGTLLKYAKKHGIHKSTVCKQIKNGKIKISKSEKR